MTSTPWLTLMREALVTELLWLAPSETDPTCYLVQYQPWYHERPWACHVRTEDLARFVRVGPGEEATG